jgi:hypothetical protein
MNRVLTCGVCLFCVASVRGADLPATAQSPGSGSAPVSAAAPTKELTTDERLAEVEAKTVAARAKQEEIDKKVAAIDAAEQKARNEVMEAGKQMWAMVDLEGDIGGDPEVTAIKQKIAALEEQAKELRMQMQKKLDENPEFLQRKMKVQDSRESAMKMRKDKGDLLIEKAKLNSELRQLERDRLALLIRRESEQGEAKKAQEAKGAK